MEGSLFAFGQICYFCTGSQKINILTVQYRRISNEQGVYRSKKFVYILLLECFNEYFFPFKILKKCRLHSYKLKAVRKQGIKIDIYVQFRVKLIKFNIDKYFKSR